MARPPGPGKGNTPPEKRAGSPVRRADVPDSAAPAGRSRTGVNRPPIARSQPSRRSTSWLPIAAAVGVVVVLLAIGVYFLVPRQNASQAAAGATPAAQDTGAINLGVLQTNEGQTHVPEGSVIQYVNNPPSSGNHYPSPKPWGVYEQTIAPGYWVHNLEHGGVVVLYDCPQVCPEVVQMVRDALQRFPKDNFGEVKLVSTPYSGLPNGARTAAVAWNWVATYPGSITFDQLQAFYNAHVDRSPENIP